MSRTPHAPIDITRRLGTSTDRGSCARPGPFEHSPEVGDLDSVIPGQQDLPRLDEVLLAMRDRIAEPNDRRGHRLGKSETDGRARPRCDLVVVSNESRDSDAT